MFSLFIQFCEQKVVWKKKHSNGTSTRWSSAGSYPFNVQFPLVPFPVTSPLLGWPSELWGAVVPIVLGCWWFLCSWSQKSTRVVSCIFIERHPPSHPETHLATKNAVLFKIRSCVHSRKVVLFCSFKDRYVWLFISSMMSYLQMPIEFGDFPPSNVWHRRVP